MNTAIKTRALQAQGLSTAERDYLRFGLRQPDGKLPLFDRAGQEISKATIKSCLNKGLADPWFANPLNPNWMVCRLTQKGRVALRHL